VVGSSVRNGAGPMDLNLDGTRAVQKAQLKC